MDCCLLPIAAPMSVAIKMWHFSLFKQHQTRQNTTQRVYIHLPLESFEYVMYSACSPRAMHNPNKRKTIHIHGSHGTCGRFVRSLCLCVRSKLYLELDSFESVVP